MAPASIDSNQSGLAFTEESALKTLAGDATQYWLGLEPNSYSDFGPNYSTVARTPITNTRQKNKGKVVDIDVKAGFNMDFAYSNFERLLQGFFWANVQAKPATRGLNYKSLLALANDTQLIAITAITTGPNQFQAAAGLNTLGLVVGHLCNARDTGVAADDGLFKVTTIAAGAVGTSKALTANATPPATCRFQAVGFEFGAGDLTITVAGALVTLGSTIADFTTMGLVVGEWIWIGGDAAGNQFATAADKGFARIASIAAHAVVLDICNFAAVTDNGAAKTMQIFFGRVLRNAITPSAIVRRSYTLERTLGNDGVGTQAEYCSGCIADQFTLNTKEAAKVTADITFVGMDVDSVTGTQGLKAGTRVNPLVEDVYNTSHDMVMAKLFVIDPTTFNPTALYGYADDLKLVINNGVKPNKALTVFGAFEASASYFDVSGTVTAYFSNVSAISKIRNSADVALTAAFAAANRGFLLDVPLLGLGGGINKVEQDKPIMVDLTQSAGKCPNGYTALVCFFDYLPTLAMPS